MPWAAIDVPSLAVGVLRSALAREAPEWSVTTVDANLDLVDWLCDRMPFDLERYELLSVQTYFIGCGDWAFTAALHQRPTWRIEEFRRLLGIHLSDEERTLCERLHAELPAFVDELAGRLAALEPDVVGFTSTFQQNVASLATCRALKEIRPATLTVLGGANCDGEQGAALHRNFPFVDYVVRGEGERALPALLRRIEAGTEPTDVPGLCWRDGTGQPRVSAMTARPLRPAELPAPDFDGYFARFATSVARTWVEPKLVVEGARGCWWGQKHHCTFCGLNGTYLEFRSKDPQRFLDEVVDLARRHETLDFYVVDNILDMGYIRTLLPRLADRDYDLRLHYEVKANLRRRQLETLRGAGLVHVQPGIESLSSRVLAIMRKGVTGAQNVRLLRDAETVGITMYWNYLYGFPGESPDDYRAVIAQLPALHHLMPPTGATRIALERFSPYFDDPELGFTARRPAAHYRVNYDLPEHELADLAYVFETPDAGIDEATGAALLDAVRDWSAAHPESRLSAVDEGNQILLLADRGDYAWHEHRLRNQLELAAFRLLEEPHAVGALTRRVAEVTGTAPDRPAIDELVEQWRSLGLLFVDGTDLVHVVPAESNQPLLHLRPSFPSALPVAVDGLPILAGAR
jgi:ribosomal peptide maturation radical SAM protein 1